MDKIKDQISKLDLPDALVDDIMDIYDTHLLTLKIYSVPKGKMAMTDNLNDIESLSVDLLKKLKKLSGMEKQFIEHNPFIDIFKLKGYLINLSDQCKRVKKMDVPISKKKPFELDLTLAIWKLFEHYNVKSARSRSSLLCKTVAVLFPVEDVDGDAIERAYTLLRKASEHRKGISK